MAFGQEENTNAVNTGGRYKDPQSGKELEVVHNAGADALVRLGWVRVGDAASGPTNPDHTPAQAAEAAAKADKAKKEGN